MNWINRYGFQTMTFTIKGIFDMQCDKPRCRFCETDTNDFKFLNYNTFRHSGIEICVNRQGMLRVRAYPNYDEVFDGQEIINIRYCPVCGREFDAYTYDKM